MVIDKFKLEVMAEAVVKTSGYHIPEGDLYQARNPGGLRAYSNRYPADSKGNRVFTSMINGMRALFHDLELKITGMSVAKLKPEDTLTELAVSYNQPASAAQAWSKFLKHGLHDESITHKTKLSYFQKDIE